MGGSEIAGAEITFSKLTVAEDEDGTVKFGGEETVVDQWTSGEEKHTIETKDGSDIEDGYYVLHETAAPDGYTVATDIYVYIEGGIVTNVTYDAETSVLTKGAEDEDNTIVITDSTSTIHISKREVAGGEIEGAELTLTLNNAKSEKPFENVIVKQGENVLTSETEGFKISGNEITFISTDKSDTVIERLPDGEYTLTETMVPKDSNGEDKYVKAESITFTIENGVITKLDMAVVADKENYEKPDGEHYENHIEGTAIGTGVVMRDATTTTTTVTTETSTSTSTSTSISTSTSTSKPTSTSTSTSTSKPTSTSTSTSTSKPTSTSTSTSTSKPTSTSTSTSTSKPTSTSTSTSTSKPTSTSTTVTSSTVTSTSSTVTSTTSTATATTTTGGGTVAPGQDTRTTSTKGGIIDDDYDTRTKTTATTTSTTETETTSTTTTTVLADINISKQDIYGVEVAGAELTLTGVDAEGNEIEFYEADAEFGADAEFINDGSSLRWISGTEPTFIKNLPDGEYVLHEIAAPDGFETTTDIRFTIENGKLMGWTDDTVVMIDTRVGEAQISKKNVYGDEIPGAELTLTGKTAEGEEITFNAENIVPGEGAVLRDTEGASISWISGTTPTIVKNLPDGTYTLHEVAAPSGYEVATDITFTVYDGKIIGGTEVEGSSVTMFDDMKLTEVSISKENVLGKEIAGATLTLTGTDLTGRRVTFEQDDIVLGSDAEFKSAGNSLTWVSGSEESVIRNLPDGTYTLHEAAAPSGYYVATDIIFTIENGEVKGDINTVTDGSVTMVDDMILADVAISKEDVYGAEIAGAHLTLTGTDFEGNEVTFSITNAELGEGAKLISQANGTTLEFMSGTTATLIKGLPDGTYVLHEVAAPSGYKVATDITFTIENGEVKGDAGAVTDGTVTMVDDAIVTSTTTTTATSTATTTTTTDATTTTTTSATTTTTTVATTTTTTANTTTTTAARTTSTTAKRTTTTTTKKSDAPKTGVKGMGIPVAALLLAAATAFAVRKRKDEE